MKRMTLFLFGLTVVWLLVLVGFPATGKSPMVKGSTVRLAATPAACPHGDCSGSFWTVSCWNGCPIGGGSGDLSWSTYYPSYVVCDDCGWNQGLFTFVEAFAWCEDHYDIYWFGGCCS
jgi:hypothetical protein